MLFVAPDFEAPPSISAAYADYRTHQFLDTADDETAGGSADPDVDEPTASRISPASDVGERFKRRHGLGKAGVIVYTTGVVVQTVGVVVVVASALDSTPQTGNVGAAVGGVGLVVLGGVTSVVGEVMLFTGGIGASQLVGKSPVVGWVGVGLAAASIPLNFVDPTVAGLAGLGGLVCGAVQLGQAGNAGRAAGLISLRVAPTPNGFLVAGAF